MTVVNLGKDSSGRPLQVDQRTLDKLHAAEKRLGFNFTVVQGSWRAGHGAHASAGTHDRGGVIDLRSWNIPDSIGIHDALVALRKSGLIAWYRTQSQGFDPHIHCIDYGNPALSRDAAQQVHDWERGLNGLANRHADDGPKVPIPKEPPSLFPIPERPHGMNNVQYGRLLVSAGLKELAKAKGRGVVRAQAAVIRAALAVMPKS